MISDAELACSEVIQLVSDFKSVNNRLGDLKRKLHTINESYNSSTKRVNAIYHTMEVHDFNAVESSKVYKELKSALRSRRASKMALEYTQAIIEKLEDFDVKFKPLINKEIDKSIGEVAHKHGGVDSKSKGSVKFVMSLISKGE